MEDTQGVVNKIEVRFKNAGRTEIYITSWNQAKEFDKIEITQRFIKEKKILLKMEKYVEYISHKVIGKLGL
jgi:hypothetical protein